MAEILFVLLTIYVVYVLQKVFCKSDGKTESGSVEKVTAKAEAVSEKKTEAVAVAEEKPAAKKSAAKKATKPAAKPKPVAKAKPKTQAKAKSKSTTKAKAEPASTVPSGSLRNPDTGDVDKIASSYRMTKRWIKEALVTEGLLPKVYKTAELDDATKEKVKKAVDKLAKMDKYR